MSVRNVVWGLATVSAVVLMLSHTTSKPPTSQASTQVEEGSVAPDAPPVDTAPTSAPPPGGLMTSPPTGATSGTRPGASPSRSSSGASPSGSTSSGGRKSVTGGVFQAGHWGPFQVRATFNGTKLVGVTVLQHPTGGQSDSINAEAIPQLTAAALRSQGASGIDSIAGATLTSQAYRKSLQSAIDRLRG